MYDTVVSIIVMVILSIFGFAVGSALDNPFGGAILFAIISGFTCMIYILTHKDENNKN